MIKAFIFDLDGVITETSHEHYKAWHHMALMLGIEIDESVNERLKGVSRMQSLDEILQFGNIQKKYSDAEREKLCYCKNEYYKNLITKYTEKNIFEGIIDIFETLKEKGIKIAIGSASHNAPTLIKAMGLQSYIDYIVNPGEVEHGKPAPDIFLKAAQVLGAQPHECIGIEDAVAGVKAIKSAGMYAVGIGDSNILNEADVVFGHVKDMDVQKLIS